MHTIEHNGQLVGMGFDFVTLLQTVDSYFGRKLKKMNQIFDEELWVCKNGDRILGGHLVCE